MESEADYYTISMQKSSKYMLGALAKVNRTNLAFVPGFSEINKTQRKELIVNKQSPKVKFSKTNIIFSILSLMLFTYFIITPATAEAKVVYEYETCTYKECVNTCVTKEMMSKDPLYTQIPFITF
jgi:hypothetical protein